MTSAARIAVVIAAYDPGAYLRPALDSVLAQTLREWECVVVDDGSTQDLRWVRSLDERIRLVRQVNAGVSRARNAGVAMTSAPLLAFLDHDDLWRPAYLARQVEQFADPAVDLVSTGFDIVDASGHLVGPGFVGHNASYADLLTGCGLNCGTVAVRRTAFDRAGGFRPYPVSQDWDLWLRVLRDGGGVARCDTVLGSWRTHGSNASADYRSLWRDGRRLLREHRHPSARTGRRSVRRLAAMQAFDAARAERGRPTACLRHLTWAAAHAPSHVLRSAIHRGSSRAGFTNRA